MSYPCSQPVGRISSVILVMQYARWLLTNESLKGIDMEDEGITAFRTRIASELETGML
jgi:hypothetical protein